MVKKHIDHAMNRRVGRRDFLKGAAAVGAWGGWAGAVVLVTGLAAGASDSVASEIGKAFGGQPRLLPTFTPAPAGTPGAVTVAGTLAGIVSAALVATPAFALGLLPWAALPVVVVACTVGAVIESMLAAATEHHGILNNDLLNVVNTAAAAAVAVSLASPAWLPARLVL